MAVVRSPDFLRGLNQRDCACNIDPPASSYAIMRREAATAERTVGPARMIAESLTPKPGIREQYRHKADIPGCLLFVRFRGQSGHQLAIARSGTPRACASWGISWMLRIAKVSTVSESCSPRPLRAFGSAMLMIGAVLSAFATAFAGQCVFADPVEPGSEEAGLDTSALCNPEDTVVYAPQAPSTSERPCPAHTREEGETARARAYLIATATPGYTMTRQGPERAIE